jgi:hypothetical protein
MKYYHTVVAGPLSLSHPISATCKEEAWDYSRTNLKPGEYVWELFSDSKHHRVEHHVRKGTGIHDEVPFLPMLGCVVSYCESDMRVRFLEPVSHV